MTKSQPRSFSSAGKVSRVALGTGALLVALSAVTAGVVARAGTVDPATAAGESARRVLGTVEAWQSENPVGCPSITALVESGYLSRDARTDDAWGNRFRIVCDARAASIHSAGPDKRFGTKDDVTIAH
jgi:hypothetical protein